MSGIVKCLVWDLDDTLWDGVLLEGDRPVPFPAAVRTLTTLDGRGILHAAASRGDHPAALAHSRRSRAHDRLPGAAISSRASMPQHPRVLPAARSATARTI